MLIELLLQKGLLAYECYSAAGRRPRGTQKQRGESPVPHFLSANAFLDRPFKLDAPIAIADAHGNCADGSRTKLHQMTLQICIGTAAMFEANLFYLIAGSADVLDLIGVSKI